MADKRLKIFGMNVKFARIKKELSQEKLAELIDTSRTTISMIETARQNPTILKIIDMARALDVSIDDLSKDV